MIEIRVAVRADVAAIAALIERSARELGAQDYTSAQIEGALRGAFGVDTQLIDDGSYFVAVEHGTLVGAGGWSRRATLFGGDAHGGRDGTTLDPLRDAARIRAFFVAPTHARRGIGSLLLQRCEAEARAGGFRRVQLMATLPGVRLYAARGYVGSQRVCHDVGGGLGIEFVPMHKDL